ncbi:MAG: transposase [Desulfuromonadales bacterium]|nr:transposase [Desulfuromonadales bacterium]
MARKPRIHYSGALYHVMLRGNGGMDLFGDDQDRYRFFLLLQEGVERFGYQVVAYCLMDNHIHLAIQVGETPLSRAMQNLSFRFTRWINWRRQRTGHLFQGRYKAILIEEDEYLLQLVAYLHLNPVRAGMVAYPLDYRWSSYRAYLGEEMIPWLNCDAVLSRLSKRRSAARKIFTSFVDDQIPLGHRKEFHGIGSKDARILGEESFVNDVLLQSEEPPLTRPDLPTCLRLVAAHFACDAERLQLAGRSHKESRVRAFVAWAILEKSSASLTELGKWLNRDVSTLSSSVRRLKEQAAKQPQLRQELEALARLLDNFAKVQA